MSVLIHEESIKRISFRPASNAADIMTRNIWPIELTEIIARILVGTWRESMSAYVLISGVWRSVVSLSVLDAGTWRTGSGE